MGRALSPRYVGPILLVWMVLGLAACAYAQNEGNVLTLDAAMQMALDRNPSVASAEASLRAARAALSGQRAQWLPSLSLDGNAQMQESLSQPVDIGGGTIRVGGGVSTTSNVTFTLRQTFFESGLAEAISGARAQRAATEASLEDTQRALLLNVASVFYTILADQELASVADQAVKASELHLQLVNARIDAGTAAAADRLPIEAELAQARYQAVAAENSVWQDLAELQALLALPPEELPLIRGALGDVPTAEAMQSWIDLALAERPDLQAQRYRVRATEMSTRQTEIAAGLSLNLAGSADYGRHTGTTGDTWRLSAGLSLPLFDRGAQASVDQAHANLEVARQRLADLQLSVIRDVTQSWHAATDAQQRIAAAQAALGAAKSSLDAAQARYMEGVATIVEVTDAELTWRNAAAQAVQSRYDRIVAYYQLRAAAGRMLSEEAPSSADAGMSEGG